MNKQEFAQRVAERSGFDRKSAEKAIDAVTGAIGDALAEGGDVRINGFGTFATRARAARDGRNPATGAAIKIPATTVAHFTPGALLKAGVAGGKKAKKVKRK